MKILILGGDGYLGWPTAMNLTTKGHQIAIADNSLRRKICSDENVEPLYNVPNIYERVKLWESISGYKINIFFGDLVKWEFIREIFHSFTPDAIIHYAEQPSAPYSMLNRRAAMFTLQNNLVVTANMIFAVREFCPDAHIIKLGTMGEYGTPDIDIEEGWIDIEHRGRKDNFLFPRQAGSLYHTTKIMDTDLLWFYVRIWDLKVTDLMQGPVYGIFTEETGNDEQLFSFFNYDELFGTVINRFVVQAVAGYPLTVYGKGGQTRGYINIKDTINCVRLSLENPAKKGQLRIFNQFTESFSVNDIANLVKKAGAKIDIDVKIENVKNPRKEAENHYYNPMHTGLVGLGLEPHYLTEDVLIHMMELIRKHKKNIKKELIFMQVNWD